MVKLNYSQYISELYDGRGIKIHPENVKPGMLLFLPPPLHMDRTEMPAMTHWVEVYFITEPCGTGMGNRQKEPGKEVVGY